MAFSPAFRRASGGGSLPWEPPPGSSAQPVAALTAPSIAGTNTVGATLTCTPGVYAGAPAPSVTRAWKRAGVAIGGATALTYVQVTADAGAALTCVETAANAVNSTASTSNTITTAPYNTVLPVLAGTSYAGGHPAVTVGTWAGATSYTYTLLVNGSAVLTAQTEATIEAYTYLLAQTGQAVIVRENATGPGGTTSADSAPVTLVYSLSSISNPIGWYELRDATLSGGNVTALVDKSAQGNDLTIGGSGAEVTLAADADYGGAVVGILGGGKSLVRTTFTGGEVAQPTTIVWLGEFATLPAAAYRYDGETTRQANYVSSGAVNVYAGGSYSAGTISADTVYAVMSIYNGASSTYYRGASWATPAYTGNPGANGINGFRLGARQTATVPMTGRVAIAAVFAKAVSADDIAIIAGYLNQEFGQSITT